MSNYLVTFLVDGNPGQLAGPASLAEVVSAAHKGSDPMNPIVGVILNGRLTDLGTEISAGPQPYIVDCVSLLDPKARQLLRHSMAHLAAQAVQRLIVGSKEELNRTVSVRDRAGHQENDLHIDHFIQRLRLEIDQRGREADASIFEPMLFTEK